MNEWEWQRCKIIFERAACRSVCPLKEKQTLEGNLRCFFFFASPCKNVKVTRGFMRIKRDDIFHLL